MRRYGTPGDGDGEYGTPGANARFEHAAYERDLTHAGASVAAVRTIPSDDS